MNKIAPALWFHTDQGFIQPVLAYYSAIFGTHFQSKDPMPLGITPSGNAEICYVSLYENRLVLMSTALEHHAFNDSFAMIIHCQDQQEIDRVWNYFTEEGKESMCGWCQDKFGLRWQVIPFNLSELMAKPNAFEVLSKQRKIVIADFG